MDVSSTVATWLSLAVTIAGLGSIVTQFGTIIEQADPFHTLRGRDHLGEWSDRQRHVPWYHLMKPPPVGPVIRANLILGLCGRKSVYISRLPMTKTPAQASWAVLLDVIHATPHFKADQRGLYLGSLSDDQVEKMDYIVKVSSQKCSAISRDRWTDLELYPLVKHNMTSCTVISRATLIALFCVTNAKPVFRHSGASGHRAAYASYCGQWRVEWPIGDIARVHFSAHDLHNLSKDVYPPIFEQRVDKCLQMLAGVLHADTPGSFKCAFPGRKSTGEWVLEYSLKGFGGAHGGRHLYNMIGGNVNEVDFFLMKPARHENLSHNAVVLHLPNKENGHNDVVLYVPEKELGILNKALDYLPWSPLSWSVHRGLRDILVAFCKKRLDQHRNQLAATLRSAVEKWPERLDSRGWNPRFVRENMADMAVGAVMAGGGNSGDVVRIVTDIALTLWDGSLPELDQTSFWRYVATPSTSSILQPMAVVALVKCFVLEWSNELDYQMYHDFPQEMYLG